MNARKAIGNPLSPSKFFFVIIDSLMNFSSKEMHGRKCLSVLKNLTYCRLSLFYHNNAYHIYKSEDGLCVDVTLHFFFFEPTCANARWALMSRFLSVCPSVCLSVCLSVRLSVTRQKLLDNNSYLRKHLS